jgi:hypothetical protein
VLALIGFVALVVLFAALPFGHWTRPLRYTGKDPNR